MSAVTFFIMWLPIQIIDIFGLFSFQFPHCYGPTQPAA